MPSKATRVICNSQDPESRPPLTLSPLAVEDLTDEPQFVFTPEGLTEVAAHPDGLLLTSEIVKSNLTEFLLAYQERQNARGAKAVMAAMNVENRTALSLAWSILNELGLL